MPNVLNKYCVSFVISNLSSDLFVNEETSWEKSADVDSGVVVTSSPFPPERERERERERESSIDRLGTKYDGTKDVPTYDIPKMFSFYILNYIVWSS